MEDLKVLMVMEVLEVLWCVTVIVTVIVTVMIPPVSPDIPSTRLSPDWRPPVVQHRPA